MDDADNGRDLVARYDGRAGIAAVGAILSETQSRIQDSAKGSGIAMSMDQAEENPGTAQCHLWLKNWGSAVGPFGTADVGILRPYLQDARNRVASLHPSAKVWSQ